MNAAELTGNERQTLKLRERLDDQDGVKLNGWIGLVSGLIMLAIAVVVQNWWPAVLGAAWVVVWGAVLIRAN